MFIGRVLFALNIITVSANERVAIITNRPSCGRHDSYSSLRDAITASCRAVQPVSDVSRARCCICRKAIVLQLLHNNLHNWRRGRDSNPRYGFRPYNGLANRRLQPLGHLSVRGKHVFGGIFSVKALIGCSAGNLAKARWALEKVPH